MPARKILLLCLLAIALPVDAGDRVAMRLSPPVGLEPAVLTVRTVVETDPDNRALQIVARSADYYRSSWIELAGASAARVNVFEFRNLPTGTYEVSAVLVGAGGERGSALQVYHVTSPLAGSR